MIVPLSVEAKEEKGKEKLVIWTNGKKYVVDTPIEPYFYSYRDDLPVIAKKTKKMAIALSNKKERMFWKYEFNTRDSLTKSRSTYTFEDNIPFVLRLRIDLPEIYTKYANTNDLTFLFLDIEQDCPEGQPFPTYDNIITSISYCTNDRVIHTFYLKKETKTDKKLLEKFLEVYEEINPDIIVVYNKGYDIPTILNRCIRNEIDTKRLSRDKSRPYIGGKDNYHIEGVLIYDVLLSARADQSLTGHVINRGLKEVSNYYGFKEKRKPLTPKQITEKKGTEELVEYNKDDVRRLLLAFDVYWANIEFNANDLKIPLSESVLLKTSNLGIIVIGDEYREQNIIADGTNYDRYPEIFQRKKVSGEPNYQGALIDIFQTGRFEPVHKIDYSSLYPSIVASFNLSPDTTTLLDYQPYTGKFSIEEEENWFIYTIPDLYLKKDMIIQVSKKIGFMSFLVSRFLKERLEYKKLWRLKGNVKDRAISDNRKVKANGGVYGNMGYSKHPFGFAPIAVATCGIGRECGQLLIDVLEELYPNSVIEVDTDGVYYSAKNCNEKEILSLFGKKLFERFKKKLDLTVDIDEYDAGYFYKSKNYVLLKGDRKILHGVAFTSSSKDKLSKNFINEMTDARLLDKPTKTIEEKYMKLDFPLLDFALNIKLGMNIESYANKNSLSCRLALEAKERFGIEPEIGNQYYYIKSKSGYTLFELAKKEELDLEYYRKELETIIDMLSVDNPKSNLENWI